MIWDDKRFYNFCQTHKLQTAELLYIKEHIDDIINSFPVRDQRFIKVFVMYNTDRYTTYAKVGQHFEVSSERVYQIAKKMERRIIKKALENLYHRTLEVPNIADTNLDMLEEHGLSTRTLNVLNRHHLYTVSAMIRYLNINNVKSFAELKAKAPCRHLRNAGEKSIKEMDDLVTKILKMSEEKK